MRWRQAFLFEVVAALRQLGMQACPVCRSTDTLSVSPYPTHITDAGPPPGTNSLVPWEEFPVDLTFAVRVECTTCGHLMLFNSQQYRRDDEKILELQAGDDLECQPRDNV